MSPEQPRSPLGSYLRARRAQVDPAAHGLPPGRRRRVVGLRREEVADLAGVSLDYYIRLEQGRDRRPSPAVLEALADALRLDAAGREHLRHLHDAPEAMRGRQPVADGIRPEVAHLLTLWHEQAALVVGRYRQVLAVNAAATALNENFTLGKNLMREVFLDPDARRTYPDWEQVATEGVAALRAAVGAHVLDAERDQLVDDLCRGSSVFAELWSQHDARAKPSGRQRFRTRVGVIELQYEPFTLPGSVGQTLYVFYPVSGSTDERLFGDLIATTTTSAEPTAQVPDASGAQHA